MPSTLPAAPGRSRIPVTVEPTGATVCGPDTLTTSAAIEAERRRLRDVGCDDLLLFPCAPGLEQVGRLAEALDLARVAA